MQPWLLPFDKIDDTLRKLAKTDHWQTLFSQAKELSCIQLFHNTTDFTQYQIYFLNQMSFYSSLYYDIASNEVSEIVLNDPIYEDAYWMYRTEERLKKTKRQTKSVEVTPNANGSEQVVNHSQWNLRKVKSTKGK